MVHKTVYPSFYRVLFSYFNRFPPDHSVQGTAAQVTILDNSSFHVQSTGPPVLRSALDIQSGTEHQGRKIQSTPETLLENKPRTESLACKAKQRIVFLKTHKTASTTLVSILERYGYYRNLTFAVGKSHILSFQNKFVRGNVLKFPGMQGKPFDMLTNHARYNRPEMDFLVPNATYITILRKPEDQLDSAFGYFEMYRGMKLENETNPLEKFMEDPMKYYLPHKYHMWQLSRNGMLFDLGLEHKYDEDDPKIVEKIQEIDGDFDLVLLSDFFDESLILLKRLLCWEYEDILYLSCGIRSASHRFENNEELAKRIRAWSHGDVLLYNHFNNTFWKRVKDYGPTFKEDLRHFRELNQRVYDDCIDRNNTNKSDKRVEKLKLKNTSERCKRLQRGDINYTPMIRKSMKSRFGSPS